MKTIIAFLALTTVSIASIAADSVNPAANSAAAKSATTPGTAALPAGHPTTPPSGHPATMPSGHGAAGAADMSKSDAPLTKKGKVVSVVDAKQFTYIEVQDGKKTQWLAAPAIAVKAGNMISYADGEIMAKFHSKALNRDFSNVLFTTRVVVDK